VLALSRLSFDLSVYDIFGLLAAGGTIVLPSVDRALDPAHWRELIVSEGVSVWNTVPALMRLLAEEPGLGEGVVQSLRLIMMSGDWIPTNLPAQIRRLCPQAKIVSLGGATEASIWSILFPIEQVDPNWKSIPYGKPMLNQQFHVLTETFAPRPLWVPGQLYIGGIGVAKGYWRDEEKTRASFINNPATGERLYRTGDLGRYLPDGNIEFLGREDFQVKVQGYRIELGEIEAVLSGHPAVKDSVVTVLEGTSGGRHIRAYVVPRARQSIAVSDVQAFLKQRLPSYMVPSEFVVIAALPLSPTGKVDRKSLLLNPPPPAKRVASCVEPRSALERQILGIWEELLETRPIGVRDDFFELGGDSLLAVRLMYRIEQTCGRKLPVDTLFGGATIEDLAKALLKVQPQKLSSPLVEVQSGESDPPFFFCHGDFSGGYYCRKLAPQLGKQLTFCAVAPHGLDGEKVPKTIEAMAADRLRHVLERQPRGPYLLGGYSHGGLVAFEMACQIRKLGLRVDRLVVVDMPAMNFRFRGRRRLLSFLGFLLRRDQDVQVEWFLRLRDFFTVLSRVSRKGRRAQAIFVLKKIKRLGKTILGATVRPSASQTPLPHQGPDVPRQFLECVRAVEGYVPGRYDGSMVFVRSAAMQSESASDLSAGWSRVAKHVEIRSLPGDHKACVKEHLGILAEHLESYLRNPT
jgi:thioesterase domain-containing protein/acyl carrier protein